MRHHSPRPRLLACALAALSAAMLTPSSYASPAESVDLSVRADMVQQAPGTTGKQFLTVTNQGSATTGKALLTYVTPPYTNVDRSAELPAGCSMRYENPDPTVPEVVTCVVSEGLGAGERQLAIPLSVTQRARITGMVRGLVTVVPAADSPDVEAAINDNWMPAYLSLTRPTPATPEGNRTGLYLAGPLSVLTKEGTADPTLVHGNVGPAQSSGQVQISAVTPFTFNVDETKPLPEGCSLVLKDSFIGTPEIVVCQVPALAVEEQRTLTIPLRRAEGAHAVGLLLGPALIAPLSPDDVDPDQTDNIATLTVMAPNRDA
ncbi:hypothetical protein PV682_31890 [Streptomyces niveiscabiei]|uniref:hypothetical protein n=1 Tax=Streptomyces niveiscabiei TaxID=164115 RepID=UPI0029AEF304|nr:hypothetical protein [Streptomyces niveiscabiei]MDX3386025.1 hypothetical protein [Streptomyces niveiscabiei]